MKAEILMAPSKLPDEVSIRYETIEQRAKQCQLACMEPGKSWKTCIHGFACEIRKFLLGDENEAE